jgi:hypothetical protein
VQLRPMALPPKVYEVQFGRTLKFVIEYLVICPGDDRAAALATLQERADSLNSSIDDYAEVTTCSLDHSALSRSLWARWYG